MVSKPARCFYFLGRVAMHSIRCGILLSLSACLSVNQGRSRRSGRSGHVLATISATNFFYYSLPFKVIAQLPPLLQHFGTTWPDHFSKADYERLSVGHGKPIDMPFGVWTRRGPVNHVLGGARILPRIWAFL